MLAGSLVVPTSLLACSFVPGPNCDPYSVDPINVHACLSGTPPQDPYEVQDAVLFEVPGKIRVEHAHSCAKGPSVALQVHGSAPIPGGFDRGTVVFNGWHAWYEDTDNQVRGFGGSIFDVNITPSNTLDWNAAGAFSDGIGHSFDWCYWYTLVFWNSAAIDANTPQFDCGLLGCTPVPGLRVFTDSDNGTALHSIAASIDETADKHPAAILPRGFFSVFTDSDHHLLQGEFQQGLPTVTPTLFGINTSWTSQTLLKDNSPYHPFSSGQFAEKLSGTGVSVFRPSVLSHFNPNPPAHWEDLPNNFALAPQDPPAGACIADSAALVRNTYCVHVPFSYAVPMLTGWKVDNDCGDSNVFEMGAWIDNFTYTPFPDAASATSGTLCYEVVTALQDNSGGRQNILPNTTDVTILALSPPPTVRTSILRAISGPLIFR
jgi:hypothetical protein